MNGANTAWILTSSALVLFMTLPGLGLFYAGLVKSRNAISTLAQCYGIAAVASVVWFVAGYSIAFSGENNYIGDLSKAFLSGVSLKSLSGDIPEILFVMFQMTFAIITPALIVGAYVERIKFSAVLFISTLWILAVYAPVTHWVWGGGWLADMGVFDFAGGLVVHATAGVSAIVIVKVLGPRVGFPEYFDPPHSPVIAMVGAGMLWVGWFG
ncbi:MAG: ammonia channel protein, partial [Pelagibacteraceae bacterium]